MPVDFLTDEQAAGYGRFAGEPTRRELERFFFLDDEDRRWVDERRRDHNRLGYGLQLGTVRFLGTFLADPVDVPVVVVDFVAEQLGISDPSCVKRYAQRPPTHREHAGDIAARFGYRDFGEAAGELAGWIAARVWNTGEGPKSLFDAAVGWLIERRVLLPGVTTLTRLVARVRDASAARFWATVAGFATADQVRGLEALLVVPETARVSELERLATEPARLSGTAMVRALQRVSEIGGLGFAATDTTGVPARRLELLARHGIDSKATAIRRMAPTRRAATLVAVALFLRARAVDDALELLDVLMVTRLLARAVRASNQERLRTLPRFASASSTLAAAVAVLCAEGRADDVTVAQLWAEIETVVSRQELATAVATVAALAPPPDSDADEAWRAELVGRIGTVRSFVGLLGATIEFGATAAAAPILEAMNALPDLLTRPHKRIRADEVDLALVTGSWRPLVLAGPNLEPGLIDWRAYVFCVLEQFHRALIRRDIYAPASSRWGDPRAQLLAGPAWADAKATVLQSLSLPEDPTEHLAGRARLLDDAYRDVAAGVPANAVVEIVAGELQLGALGPAPASSSIKDLRRRVAALMPRVDLPELLLEVATWTPYLAAFTPNSGGAGRLADLDVSMAACLTAAACNIGLVPVADPGVAALTPGRLSYLLQEYVRRDTIKAANACLIDYQASIGLAQTWGGGLVASIDGVRFVVPVRTIYARPNPKYFGRRSGATWMNMLNDQAAGLAGLVVSGTPRDSLRVLDVIAEQDSGVVPEMIITDTGSYSDIVFGLLTLAGKRYAPQLADLPDRKFWRIDPAANYGPLDELARGRINLDKIARHWPDILRVAGSLHTGSVRSYDVIRMLQREGHPTQLGDAIAHYGRIAKTLHMLQVIDDPIYRRLLKRQSNLTESRHALARRIFHGQLGELRRHYIDGMEDQLGALGLVLNAVVLFNTRYMDAALDQLRAEGYPVNDDDVTHLSPFIRKHINVQGRYRFSRPALAGRLRPLRDPSQPDDPDELDED